MKKLIQVVRGTPDRGVEVFLPDANIRRHIECVVGKELDMDRDNFVKAGEFFLVNDGDEAEAQRRLAEQNPGCEVRIYGCEGVAQTTVGPLVVKTVSKDGVLPG